MVSLLGINEQLEELVSNCELCLKYLKAKNKQAPNMSLGQEVPIYAWTKIATDILHLENKSYLLLVDYTSRFPIVCKLTSTMAQQVASHMKLIFSEYGWPETIVSDNSPCYSAELFTKLMTEYSVNHITSSPALSTIQQVSREICTNSEKGRRYRLIQRSNDL